MIKHISMEAGVTMQAGVEKTLIDMIVQTNENTMVGAGFPRVERKVLHPVHACLGELEITGGGVVPQRSGRGHDAGLL